MVVLAGADLAAAAAEAADSAAAQVSADGEHADSGLGQTQATAAQAAGALARLSEPAERIQDPAGRSKSEATIRAYAAGWRDFLGFCEPRGLSALPASNETVAAYLPSPTSSSLVRRTHAGVRRTLGTAQTSKAPALVEDLKRMLNQLSSTRVGLSDRAQLLLGFASAFRRCELVSLEVANIEFTSAGLIVPLRRSKTVREGSSRRLASPHRSSEATRPGQIAEALARVGVDH